MSASDQERRALYDRLEAVLGPPQAATLMELLPPVGWSDVARRGDIAELRGEMAELRGEMAALRADLKGDIAELRVEMHGMLPRLLAANLASMIGVAALVLAAVAIG